LWRVWFTLRLRLLREKDSKGRAPRASSPGFRSAESPRVPGMRLRPLGPSRPSLRRLTAFFVAGLFVLAGCRPAEQVTRFTAPKEPPDPDLISDEPGENEPAVRILGAIAPAGKPGEESWYFFKFQPAKMGETYTPKAIDRHAAEFNAFIQS